MAGRYAHRIAGRAIAAAAQLGRTETAGPVAA